MHDDAWLARAIERYHELCADGALAGPDVVLSFARAQAQAGLTFGGTVQCRSLRPAFMTVERVEELRRAVSALWGAFGQLEARAVHDASLAGELGLSAQERALAAIDPGYEDATVVSRLDAFFAQRPRVLEYNADSPAGMSYQAGQAAIMRTLPVMQRFAQEYSLEELRADIALRETLLAVWREFALRKGIAASAPVQIAILDLAGAATGAEFRLVQNDLNEHGAASFIATPEDLTYEGGKLRAFGRRVDMVYKRLLVADFLAHYDLQHPLVRAYADGAVCVASSFRCTIAHKKKALTALRNPSHAAWFSDEQCRAIEELVPVTVPLDRATMGRLGERDNLVLKPNDAHGGEGVVIGADCSPAGWQATLENAAGGDFVLQERIAPTLGGYPIFDAEAPQAGAQLRTLVEDCNAYVFRGRLGGVLTRLSESAVINVSKGGQAIPTFIIH